MSLHTLHTDHTRCRHCSTLKLLHISHHDLTLNPHTTTSGHHCLGQVPACCKGAGADYHQACKDRLDTVALESAEAILEVSKAQDPISAIVDYTRPKRKPHGVGGVSKSHKIKIKGGWAQRWQVTLSMGGCDVNIRHDCVTEREAQIEANYGCRHLHGPAFEAIMPVGYLFDVGGEEPPEERKPRILKAVEELKKAAKVREERAAAKRVDDDDELEEGHESEGEHDSFPFPSTLVRDQSPGTHPCTHRPIPRLQTQPPQPYQAGLGDLPGIFSQE